MAINKNHEFEDLGGVKCAIVEKNVLPARAQFLRALLEFNSYTVVVVPSAPPKVVPAPAATAGPTPVDAMPADVAPPETCTVGVTDTMFNATNAIFGRLLKTIDGRVVTLAFWRQHETIAHDQIPYYENL